MTRGSEATGVRLLAWYGIFLKEGDYTFVRAVPGGKGWMLLGAEGGPWEKK